MVGGTCGEGGRKQNTKKNINKKNDGTETRRKTQKKIGRNNARAILKLHKWRGSSRNRDGRRDELRKARARF